MSRDQVDSRPADGEAVCTQKQIPINMGIILGRYSLYAVLFCIHLYNATVLLEQDLNYQVVLHGDGLLKTYVER